jgi:hypothetical protein
VGLITPPRKNLNVKKPEAMPAEAGRGSDGGALKI